MGQNQPSEFFGFQHQRHRETETDSGAAGQRRYGISDQNAIATGGCYPNMRSLFGVSVYDTTADKVCLGIDGESRLTHTRHNSSRRQLYLGSYFTLEARTAIETES